MKYNGITFTSNGIRVNNNFIHLEEIINNCNKERIKEQGLALMIIEWVGGRSFDGAKETIVKPFKDLLRIKEIIVGQEIYFGEIAGKHSEIYGNVEENEVSINESIEAVNDFLVECPSGHEYNHSFLYRMNDMMHDGCYPDIPEKIQKEFEELI